MYKWACPVLNSRVLCPCVYFNDEQVGSGNTPKRGKRLAVEQNPTDCSSDRDRQRAFKQRKGDVSARVCLSLIDASPAATFEVWREALIGKKLEVPGKFWRNWPDKKALYPWLASRCGFGSGFQLACWCSHVGSCDVCVCDDVCQCHRRLRA